MRAFAQKPEASVNATIHVPPRVVQQGPRIEDCSETSAEKGKALSPVHSFARVPVYAARPALTELVPAAGPASNGALFEPEEPPGEFNEENTELEEDAVPATGEREAAAEPATYTAPQAAPVPRTVIRGPRELWNFNGETPANYSVSSVLRTNRTGGTFNWSVSPQLSLSSAADATPTVTTVTPSAARRDATIRVRHTDGAGVRTAASYRLTILGPESLTHLRNVDNNNATFSYMTEIHYSIHDQFGTVLPRDIPINEQWSGAVVADSAGMNWRRGAEGAATVNPTDWHDRVEGESAGHIPAPVAPGHADAAVAVYHWPGDWRVGSLTIGNGRRVISVTWQKNRGFARHT